ncbi:CpaF family protein [Cohnella lupini]|uniref:Pilus assembly protein CpaF n=1 Tax=Cohnella lupini TaxID=1294267 RepID=A0A3D9IML9_9BACL|nr:CpaF family protein [Cohnella lupini]RED63023.1 pilus assembly protein CpaF [Cohnella lupini]
MVSDESFIELRESVRSRLDLSNSTSDDQLLQVIEDAVFHFSEGQYLTIREKQKFVSRLFNSFRGLDVLQPLIDDKSITEIMINNFDEIFIEREGHVLRHPGKFESQDKLEDIIQLIVGKVNRVVNEASPIVDARLKDGSRVNVVLPPIAMKGPTMTIRKFPENPLTVDDLIQRGALSREVAEFLKKLVKAKYNIFIGGGTGSGKTTFLNALSNYIPADERIITIEDSAELQIRSVPNLVSLEVRNANTEGKGEITMRDLIKSSLRMRPNRIVVGEVRGGEALEMLQAMNTGHDGSLSTGHANNTYDMLSRLETMVLSGVQLPVEVIRKQISSAIDIMVHLSRLRDKSRRVVEISEITGVVNGEIQLNPLYVFEEEGESPEGKVIGGLKPSGNPLQNTLKIRMAGLAY